MHPAVGPGHRSAAARHTRTGRAGDTTRVGRTTDAGRRCRAGRHVDAERGQSLVQDALDRRREPAGSSRRTTADQGDSGHRGDGETTTTPSDGRSRRGRSPGIWHGRVGDAGP
jgi:hypothetical protein